MLPPPPSLLQPCWGSSLTTLRGKPAIFLDGLSLSPRFLPSFPDLTLVVPTPGSPDETSAIRPGPSALLKVP